MLVGIIILGFQLWKASGFKLDGCVTIDFKSPQPQSQVGTFSSVDDCVAQCLACYSNGSVEQPPLNASFALLSGSSCVCPQGLELFYAVNAAECSVECQDGNKCGNTIFNRFSVYNITEDRLSSTSTSTTTVIAEPSNRIVTQANGPGASVDERQLALIVGLTLGGFILLVIVAILLVRHRRRLAIPETPQLDSRKYSLSKHSLHLLGPSEFDAESSTASGSMDVQSHNTDYLIPDVLLKTPNMIYSVHAPYTAKQQDELSLRINQVVAVSKTYSDDWAWGTEIATGAQGMFPLICLVSPSKPHSDPITNTSNRLTVQIPARSITKNKEMVSVPPPIIQQSFPTLSSANSSFALTASSFPSSNASTQSRLPFKGPFNR